VDLNLKNKYRPAASKQEIFVFASKVRSKEIYCLRELPYDLFGKD
jgi:hypothetical protein